MATNPAMTAPRVFVSNRLEILVKALAEVMLRPLSSPLDPEVIVVQSKGMERFVSMQLARHQGICANCRFPFPNAFVSDIFEKVLPVYDERSPYEPETLMWRIMKRLPFHMTRPGFESLRLYLEGGSGDLQRLQLSMQIADTFDQYLIFRPEMISRWERGEEDHWQAVLWRDLVKGYEKGHRAARAQTFVDMVRDPSCLISGLPERVSVFGISALPRLHIEVLSAISRFVQVDLFLMNPCEEYWGDILSGREMRRARERKGGGKGASESLHLEKGNSLLASMGALGRDFFELVYELGWEEFSAFEDPGEDSLLHTIQSDILHLRERPHPPDGRRGLSGGDTSVQIHSCHSPMREIEVLRDQLLHMFEEDSELVPGDVLVMTPDIEAYAPYIQAVFDAPADETTRIPFSIADRSMGGESEIIDPFLAILDLCDSRFGASQVLSILDSKTARRRFGFSQEDMEILRRWVRETRIRWAIDGKDRGALGLPAFEENTWRAGLRRLLLGYAMPGEDERMFCDLLPYDHIEGAEASLLGRFAEFTEALFACAKSVAAPQNLEAWSQLLTGILEKFFMPDEETEREMQVIRRALGGLRAGSIAGASWFDEAMDVKAIRWHLRRVLEGAGFGHGFITGGVTFCAMLPMRSIPFKVLCLIGMNSDAYPREHKALGFDLLAKHPRPGDRSRRNDDRYLFLEAILSAREKLYISHVGQSIEDNSPIPPSVLVSELTDYMDQGFSLSGKKVLDHLTTVHRLQAFSPGYFKEKGDLFSFSEENCETARRMLEARKPPVPFIARGLSEPEEAWRTVDLSGLCDFFGNPCRSLLRGRLGLYLEEGVTALEEKEPFDIKGLERYQLGRTMVGRRLKGGDLKSFFSLARVSGQLPPGTVGECVYQLLREGVERFIEKVEPCMREEAFEPLEVDLRLSGFRLMGRVEGIYAAGLIQYRYGRIRRADLLRAWIHHLVLNSIKAEAYPRHSTVMGLAPQKGDERIWTAVSFSPVEEAEDILGVLLTTYWGGLVKPLRFFPEASWAYGYERFVREKSPEEAIRKARGIWMGSPFSLGECEDPYFRHCFRSVDPLDAEFERISGDIVQPVIRHMI